MSLFTRGNLLNKKGELPPPFYFWEVLGAFSTFIIAYGLIDPAVGLIKLPVAWTPQLRGILVFSVVFLSFMFYRRKTLLPYFYNPGFWMGVASWFLAFPIVLFWSQFTEWAIKYFWGVEGQEQSAVLAIKEASRDSWLFYLFIFSVMILVPIIEEIIFRGFLQNWLRRYFNAVSSIVIASLIFAFFHYAGGQGVSNITIISSLFILSCFLGALVERTGSLRSSIGLHSIFNTMSILFILAKDNL